MSALLAPLILVVIILASSKSVRRSVWKRLGGAKALNSLAVRRVKAGKGLPDVPIRDVETYKADHQVEVDTKDGPDNWLKRQLSRETGRDWLSRQAEKEERGGWMRRQVARENGDWLFMQARKEAGADWLAKQREKEKHSFRRIYGYDEERDIIKEKQANAKFLQQIHAAESDIRRMLAMDAPAATPVGNVKPTAESVYDDIKWAVSEFFRKQ